MRGRRPAAPLIPTFEEPETASLAGVFAEVFQIVQHVGRHFPERHKDAARGAFCEDGAENGGSVGGGKNDFLGLPGPAAVLAARHQNVDRIAAVRHRVMAALTQGDRRSPRADGDSGQVQAKAVEIVVLRARAVELDL